MSGVVEQFKQKIKKKELKVAVVGLGYVGLPLAIEFVKGGFYVTGIEIDQDRLKHLKKQESYITDVTTAEIKKIYSTKRFNATDNFAVLRHTDAIIICVPTPLKRKYHPDISYIKQAVKSIGKNLKPKSLIVLESTTYPGTTEEVILVLLEESGLKHDRDFFLCFSPERIDPGNKDYPVYKIPKIIGGISVQATMLGKALYERIINRVVPVSSARLAEFVKLLENTFRLINIAMIDELAMMAHKMKVDIREVIEAASTKPFGFMPFYPGPGVGGHCIPKDPLYLYWKAKHFNFRSRFIKLASDVIQAMPLYVVNRVMEHLEKNNPKIKRPKILVVGVTYKKDILDLRKSPALDIIEILQSRNITADYYDPIVPFLKFNSKINLKSIEFSKNKLSSYDCVIIASDHSFLNYDFILKHSRMIFDARYVYRNVKNNKILTL